MKDRLGKTLEIGQTVVCLRKNYRQMIDAKVIGITKQKVRVEYNTYSGYMEDYLTDPSDVIIIKD